ncbi:universal stress protein [Halobaculum sp. CBA1158]|uniref:universal stress protein n=1 Tax=Halobaculum sp. CBA1158 TaxID=2904243 RepID=UPI001F270903|nr:universal stress protein [Halobaculum sp. CBA1158]UIP00556.1 universal stress protein [Halobaculum sp. CBA1158]
MTRRVLVPLDQSDHSTKALDHAIDVHADATLVLVNVVDPTRWISAGDDEGIEPYYSEHLERSAKESSDDLLEEAADRVRDAGGDAETLQLIGGPARSILEYLREDDADIDQVVMGSHGRTGLSRMLMGSVAEKVTRRSPVPVTVVR